MEDNRENHAIVIIGPRRCGKTTFITKELIPVYLSKDMPVFVIQGKRNDSYNVFDGKKNVQVHLLNDISESMELLRGAYNCAIFFDDAQLLIGKTLDDNVRKMIINLGQCNVDIFFVFHSFTAATRELWTLIEFLEIFKVKESAAARREFLTDQQVVEIDNRIKKLRDHEHFTIER